MIFAIFKPFMSQLTIDKIQVYGVGKEWERALLEEIDADQLPTHYGGVRIENNVNKVKKYYN